MILPALGLAGQEGNAGMVRRALLSDPSDEKGLAAALGSTWQAAAETLGVYRTGLDGLHDPAMVDRLTNAYLKYRYRSGLDDQQAGLSDALYFLETAKTASDSWIWPATSSMAAAFCSLFISFLCCVPTAKTHGKRDAPAASPPTPGLRADAAGGLGQKSF